MSEPPLMNRRDAPETPGSSSNPGGKKQNKLGYQRTSVACNHCRKRKIRCQPSDDPRRPCVNCVRMKKECITTPVQETPSPHEKARSKTETSTSSSASGVPLTQQRSTLSTARSDDGAVPQLPQQSSYENAGPHPYQASIPPVAYPPNDPPNPAWNVYQPSSGPHPMSQDNPYYQQAQYTSSHSPQYEHNQRSFQPYPQSSAGAGTHAAYTVPAPPIRSMSYGDLPAQRPYSPAAMPNAQYEGLRRAVTMQHQPVAGMTGASANPYADGMGYNPHTAHGLAAYGGSVQHPPYNVWQYSQQDHGQQEHQGYGQQNQQQQWR